MRHKKKIKKMNLIFFFIDFIRIKIKKIILIIFFKLIFFFFKKKKSSMIETDYEISWK
jgi:hypothetical protein